MNGRLVSIGMLVLVSANFGDAQVYTMGSAQCRADPVSGLVNCTGQQTSYYQKPFHEVLLEAAAEASSIQRNRAIADAMHAQANLLRNQAQESAKAAAMDRVVLLIASSEKVEGEARETILRIATEELLRLYPERKYPAGSTLLVPMSNDGWDRTACDRIRMQIGPIQVFDGTYSEASSIPDVSLLVVNMSPDINHDTLEVIFIDQKGNKSWSEKVGFAWTLNPERQTIRLADRMAEKIKSRLPASR